MRDRRHSDARLKMRLFVILATLCLLSGVFFFANGFLLTRSELTHISPIINGSTHSSFNRTVLLLVDGLYTGLLPNLSALSPESKSDHLMHYLSRLIREKGSLGTRRTYLSHFLADPPTTTMQRLKALLTGSMPTFIDAGSNFGGTELQEDNLVKQWALAGRKMCFVGDQVWQELVPGGYVKQFECLLQYPIQFLS